MSCHLKDVPELLLLNVPGMRRQRKLSDDYCLTPDPVIAPSLRERQA